MKEFIKEYQENAVFTDTALSYRPLVAETYYNHDGRKEKLPTGAITLDNGDILIRMYAPEASSVRMEVTIDPETPDLLLEKKENGYFEGILPWKKRLAGPKTVNFYVDGTFVLHPFVPIFYWLGRPANYIEVPDEEELFLTEKRIPRGSVAKAYYWSETMGSYESCLVYTPADYDGTKKYPVLYLQHGHTEDEVSWTCNGKVNYILDNMIADGEAVPFVVVMNNGMIRRNGEEGFEDFGGWEDMLLKDCIPFIERKYSVFTDKRHRAIAGLSMGSAQASKIGFSEPDTFANVGLFSGFLTLSRKDPENLPFLEMMKNDPETFEKEYKVFYRSIGANDSLKGRFDKDEVFLQAHGIPALSNYHAEVLPDRFHDWGTWRVALRHFAALLFKD